MNTNSRQRSQSFLQKFQGRKNLVGKQGLIHLLQQKIQALKGSPKTIISNRNPNEHKIQLHSAKNAKKQLNPLVQLSPMNEKDTDKVKKNERYLQSQRESSAQELTSNQKLQIQKLIQLKNGQLMHSKLRLPSINKTQSGLVDTHKLQVNTQSQETPNKRKQLYGKPIYRESVSFNSFDKLLQLDSYALKHLQCLDKFQKIVIKQKGDNSTRSVLSEPK